MREIKFRAWKPHHSLDQESGMYFVDTLVLYDENGGGEAFLVKKLGDKAITSDYLSDIQIMQYTGLKDKNGVKIFEGDILEFPSFEEGKGRIVVEYKGCMFLGCRFHEISEVVGNIYEHRHLLDNTDTKIQDQEKANVN